MVLQHRLTFISLLLLLVAVSSSFILHKKSAHSGVTEVEQKILHYESIQHSDDEDVGSILEGVLGAQNELLNDLKDRLLNARRHKSLKCHACLEYMGMIDTALGSYTVQETLIELATTLCVLSRLLTPRVCVMGVNEWSPHVFFLLRNDILASQQVCYELFGSSCATPVVIKANWTLDFPSTPKPAYEPPTNPPSGTEFAKVLHLSDIHIDIWYDEGSNAQCGEPLCCRSIDGKPDNPADAAGKYGSIASCDSPHVTLEGLFTKLAAENFDWILVTGDLPSHDVYNQTTQDNADVIAQVNDLLWKHFPNATLLQAVGNHAAAPVNIFIPPYMTEDKSDAPMSWLYEMLADKWLRWLPQSTESTIRKGGYWAWEFIPGLKVISMNSAYGQFGDWYTFVNNTDVHGMLQWIIGELQDAEDRNVKVWLISHHPQYTLYYYKEQFDKILHRYINVIVGWFNGHTHKDELRLFYDPTINGSTPVLTGYVAPSVTTYSDANMAYRVYYVDAKRPNATFRVADYDTYFLNITNAKNTGDFSWNLEYNVKKAYNMSSILPTDFDNLLTRMLDDSSIAKEYKYYFHKATEPVHCDSICASRIVKKIQQTLAVTEHQNGWKDFDSGHVWAEETDV